MDRRSFVSSVSTLGAAAGLPGVDRLVHGTSSELAAPRYPTLPRTNITVKSRYEPIAPLDFEPMRFGQDLRGLYGSSQGRRVNRGDILFRANVNVGRHD